MQNDIISFLYKSALSDKSHLISWIRNSMLPESSKSNYIIEITFLWQKRDLTWCEVTWPAYQTPYTGIDSDMPRSRRVCVTETSFLLYMYRKFTIDISGDKTKRQLRKYMFDKLIVMDACCCILYTSLVKI